MLFLITREQHFAKVAKWWFCSFGFVVQSFWMCNSFSNHTSLKIMSRVPITGLKALPGHVTPQACFVMREQRENTVTPPCRAQTWIAAQMHPSSTLPQPPPSPPHNSGWQCCPNPGPSPTSPAVLLAGTAGLPPAHVFHEFLTSYSHPLDTCWRFSANTKASSKISIV